MLEWIFDFVSEYLAEFWFIILLMFLLLLWVSGGYLMYKLFKKDEKKDILTQKKEHNLIWIITGLFVLFILMLFAGMMPFIALGIMLF